MSSVGGDVSCECTLEWFEVVPSLVLQSALESTRAGIFEDH